MNEIDICEHDQAYSRPGKRSRTRKNAERPCFPQARRSRCLTAARAATTLQPPLLSHAAVPIGGSVMSRGPFLSLAFIACLTLCGCGGGNQQKAKYRIAVIPKGLTHEFWQSVHRGAEQAAADLKDKGIAVQVDWDGTRKESDA